MSKFALENSFEYFRKNLVKGFNLRNLQSKFKISFEIKLIVSNVLARIEYTCKFAIGRNSLDSKNIYFIE